jgi:CubicO group peptidase (beta-lactamase class C family)
VPRANCAVVFAWVFIGVVRAVAAQPTDAPRDVSETLRKALAQHDIPGMVAAVVEGDRVVATGAAGVRQRGGREKVTVADKFHIGSCTKAMTATLSAMLVEEGKLKWGTTIAQALPDVKPMDPGWRAVTLEQLLEHRGGAPGDVDPTLWASVWAQKGTAARQMLVKGTLAQPPAAPPDTKYIYSNTGYAIAGLMAERAARRPWEDLMREKLFKPLGMSSAGFGAPVGSQPRGHMADGKPVDPAARASDNPAAIGPAGTVHCTVTDWAKFAALHLNGERGESKLLKPETFKKLHTPPDGEKYAMGFVVVPSPLGKGKALMHAGSNRMWLAVVWAIPESNLAVLVMCNQGEPGPMVEKACDEVVGELMREFNK